MRRHRKSVPFVEISGDENLHLLLEDHHLLRIQRAFLAEETKKLDQQQLRKLLYDVARLRYDEKLFEKMFLKINANGYEVRRKQVNCSLEVTSCFVSQFCDWCVTDCSCIWIL